MSDATYNQSAAVAACTVDAAHHHDRHLGDNEACRPHLIEVVQLGRRAVAVCPGCRRDSGFLPERESALAAALQLFSASWLTSTPARTCPVGNSSNWLGSGTASRS